MAGRRWEIDERTAEPGGGRMTKYPDGRLNGELVDTAEGWCGCRRRRPVHATSASRIAQAVYRTLARGAADGLRHPGISVDGYRLLQEMKQRGVLTMRVNALLRPTGDPAAVLAAIDASGRRDGQGDACWVGGVKLAVDGGLEGGLMREPSEEPWDEFGAFKGLPLMTAPRSSRSSPASTTAAGAWPPTPWATQPSTSCSTPTSGPTPGSRSPAGAGRSSTLSSAGPIICRDQSARLALAVQNHLYLAGPSLVSYWGPARAGLTTPVRPYLDAGLPVSSGTDAPVVPYPPLWTLYHFVTRDTISGGVLGADQRVTRAEALRMATTGNAWLTMEEDEKGSIEAGKLADSPCSRTIR